MSEGDRFDSAWSQAINAHEDLPRVKGLDNRKTGSESGGGAVKTAKNHNHDSKCTNTGDTGIVNPKLSLLSMVRRSSDEGRLETTVASPSPVSSSIPSRQQTNCNAPVKKPDVNTQGSCLSAKSHPSDSTLIPKQEVTSVTGSGSTGTPDMRTGVKTTGERGGAGVTSNPGSHSAAPQTVCGSSPPQPARDSSACAAGRDSNLYSGLRDLGTDPSLASQAPIQQTDYQNPRADVFQIATSSSSPSSYSSNSLVTSPLSPLTPTDSLHGVSKTSPPLSSVLEQANGNDKERLHDEFSRDSQQAAIIEHLSDSNNYQFVDASPSKQLNKSKDSSDCGSFNSGELNISFSCAKDSNPSRTSDTVHFSKQKGQISQSLDLNSQNRPQEPRSLLDSKNNISQDQYSRLGTLGPGVLTPVHSIACSPKQSRKLTKEPSFEDNTKIPHDFVYRESSEAKVPDVENGTAQSSKDIPKPVQLGSNANVNVAEKRGANGSAFKFLLDGQSIDLSCDDDDSLSRKRQRPPSSPGEGNKVRRSYSTPTSIVEQTTVERYPFTDKKSLSVFLGSESSYSAHGESGNISAFDESKVIFPCDKRFSAGQSSIVTVGTVATTDSECKNERKKDKKKRKKLWKKRSKNESPIGDKDASSVLSVSLPGRESKRSSKGSGGSAGIGAFFRRRSKKEGETAGARQGEEDVDQDGGSRPASEASSAKGPRRLARRGMGMFPSSNWRRLRNTLKAANEMQAPKKTKHTLTREDSFLRKFSTRNHHQNVQNSANSTDDDSRWGGSGSGGGGVGGYSGGGTTYTSGGGVRRIHGRRFVIQHDGNFMFYWLGVVTVSVLYNLWTCIARQAFREIQEKCNECWFALDALFDTIYILDIIIQFRTGYLDQGLMVYDSRKLRDRYTHSRIVYIDFLCLLPLDFLQILIGIHPMIRFPRFLKVYRSFRFIHMLESRTAYPNLIRVANLTHILFLGAHWFAAFYYMISEAEDFTGEWAYPKPVGEFADVTRKYLRSLFWSTLTLTTIGDLPPPDNSEDSIYRYRMSNAAYVFVIVSYLIGVFVFATIVGQVGNVINNRNASRQEFERLLDGAKIYMQTHNVPHNLQKRVQRWYDYVWSRGRLNGCDINSLGLLPDKLKTELAIHVNLETLKKVTIFQECQPEFLHDLVLKMKAYIFTPGDLICRRGEVAREMFIIADGVVEIISETGVMLKRMGAGDFFGEIGILNLDGGINRRTADVRSVGYLELFVLSREDVLGALKDHPEAESIIRDYGQRRLREVEAHRQKVKPLKVRGNQDMTSTSGNGNSSGPGSGGGGGGSAASQTVPNRLLATLRSLNPAVRRQSSQFNHYPASPPASAGSGGPAAVTTSLGGVTTANSSPGISCGTPVTPSQLQHQQHQQSQQCLQPGSGSASHRFVPQPVAQSGALFELPLGQQQQQSQQHNQTQPVQSSGSEDLTSLAGTGSDSVTAAECLEATLAHLQHKQRRYRQNQQLHALEKRQHTFTDDFSGRRRSLAYIRTAYTKFRNVFHRKRQQGQRRSLDSALYYGVSGKGEGAWGWAGGKKGVSRGGVGGAQSLETVEGRLLRDSLNIETCSLGSQTATRKWMLGGDEEDSHEGDRLIDGYQAATLVESDIEETHTEPHLRINNLGKETGLGNDTARYTMPQSLQQSDSFNTSDVKTSDQRKPVCKDGLRYMPLCSENLDDFPEPEGLEADKSKNNQTSLAPTTAVEKSNIKHVVFEEEEDSSGLLEDTCKLPEQNTKDGHTEGNISSEDQHVSCDSNTRDIERNTSVDFNCNNQAKTEIDLNNLMPCGYQNARSTRDRIYGTINFPNALVNTSTYNNCNQNKFTASYGSECQLYPVRSHSSGRPMEDTDGGCGFRNSLYLPEIVQEQNKYFTLKSHTSASSATIFGVESRHTNNAQNLVQNGQNRSGTLSNALPVNVNDVDNRENLPKGVYAVNSRNIPTEFNQAADQMSLPESNVKSSKSLLSSVQSLPPQRPSFISSFASPAGNSYQKEGMACVSFFSFSPREPDTESFPCRLPVEGSSSPTVDDTPTTAGTLSQSWSNDTLHSGPDLAALNEFRPRSRTSEFKPSKIRRSRDRIRLSRQAAVTPASPTAFDLMCHCNPAENYNRYIGDHRGPFSLAPLSRNSRNVDNTLSDSLFNSSVGTVYRKDTSSAMENRHSPATLGSRLGDGDTVARGRSPNNQSSPYNLGVLALSDSRPNPNRLSSPTLSRRSLSYPNLQDLREWISEPRERRSSSQEERHFTFEDTTGPNVSPTISRLRKHQSDGIQREGSGKCGRSQPMSIIQASSSEYPYHQIAEQLQSLSGLIDKRLTQMEEVYQLTTERLEQLANSQEALLQMLSQKLTSEPHAIHRALGASSTAEGSSLDLLEADTPLTASRV